MVRPMLTPHERERGRRLGATLRAARGTRTMAQVAATSGVSVETIRKIETGRIATPAFFTIAALATTLHIPLGDLATLAASDAEPPAALGA